MIKNEKQYRITKAQVRRFQDAIAELAGQARPSNISARLWEAQREAARSQMEELREQVEAYERLNAGRSQGSGSRSRRGFAQSPDPRTNSGGNDAGGPGAPPWGQAATGAAL